MPWVDQMGGERAREREAADLWRVVWEDARNPRFREAILAEFGVILATQHTRGGPPNGR